ncbi:MAG: hypothetical protein H6601_01860 [Flavobacteriales bacterium]|nr:hypothetical protein [Flavobacteriales bacterium]
MKQLFVLGVLCLAAIGCKNNGSNTSKLKAEEPVAESTAPAVKEIVIDSQRKPIKPDFQVLEMSAADDVLTVVFRYSGGCKEHDFNAYFSGAWLKSLPPQAIIDFEHLNPDNDACRSLVMDTVLFNLAPLKYGTSGSVVIKWPHEKTVQAVYEYGK